VPRRLSRIGPVGPVADGPIDGSTHRRRQWGQDNLAALASHGKDPMAVDLVEVADVGAAGFEDPQPEQAEHATRAKSNTFGEVRAVDSIASNCRFVSPSIGESGGTLGRQTYSAGEWAKISSNTQVR